MKSKRAAMEMSVGTIVTIVLLMSVLVLGIFLVQKVFKSGSGAVEAIDSQVQNEINKLFSEEGKPLAVFPNSRQITIKKGDDAKGFAFSINNRDTEGHEYNYKIEALDTFDFAAKCGTGMTKAKADSYILVASGKKRLGAGMAMEIPELVKFQIPETAVPCTIPYNLMIDDENGPFQDVTIYLTVK